MPNICQRFLTEASQTGSGTNWTAAGSSLDAVLRASDGFLSSDDDTVFEDNAAFIELFPGQSSKTLKLTNFQFGQGVDPIPSDATILAIEVRAQCKYFNGDNPGVIYKTVRLVKGGTVGR